MGYACGQDRRRTSRGHRPGRPVRCGRPGTAAAREGPFTPSPRRTAAWIAGTILGPPPRQMGTRRGVGEEDVVSDRAPSDDPDAPERQPYDYYAYRFAAERQGLHDALLREVYDDYCGQTSWTPTALYDRYFRWIDVAPDSRVLDVPCGAGGPALR